MSSFSVIPLWEESRMMSHFAEAYIYWLKGWPPAENPQCLKETCTGKPYQCGSAEERIGQVTKSERHSSSLVYLHMQGIHIHKQDGVLRTTMYTSPLGRPSRSPLAREFLLPSLFCTRQPEKYTHSSYKALHAKVGKSTRGCQQWFKVSMHC